MKNKVKDLSNYTGDIKEALRNELMFYVPIERASEGVSSSQINQLVQFIFTQHIESNKVILMFVQKIKCSRIGKIILEKNNEGFMFSRYTFKKVIKIYFKYSNYSVLLHKRRQIYQ